MGIDVTMYALLDEKPTDELMEEVKEFFASRFVMGPGEDPAIDVEGWQRYPFLEVKESLLRDGDVRSEPWLVEMMTLDRYYGPHYERGDWPSIYGFWRAFNKFWPGQVFYHGDGLMPGETEPFTAEDAEAYWQHWASSKGDAYYSRHLQGNAS